MPIRGKATVNGAVVDVELTEVTDLDGHLTEEQANLRTQTAVQARLKNHKTPEQLLDDEDHRKKVLEKLGIDPSNPAARKLSAEDIARIQEQTRKAEVDPEKAARTKAEQRAESLLGKRKETEFALALVDAGFKKHRATRLAQLYGEKLGYDEERDAFAVKDGDGFAFSAKPTKGQPHKSAAEYAAELAADPDNADDLEKRGQSTHTPAGGRGGAGAVHSITRSEARDYRKFQAAEKAAKDAGARLVILDE